MTTRPGLPSFDDGARSPVRAAGLPPPAERGATVIPEKVVARIAAQAARTAQSRRAAVPPDRSEPSAPAASAAARAGSVRLHLAMDLPYPTNIPEVCERIRHDVAERVAHLTGLEVAEVTLTVRRLLTATEANWRRVL
ncbi:Asp23/Gls24 family envelope stress response protein [Streptomyces sp. NPDC086077]|uniref:Asp23/Gls24 family envelope stress response protein n=1 Tax=Streptomyces sp. NPDC086077 TaxID=3154862 RepID=UPI003416128F